MTIGLLDEFGRDDIDQVGGKGANLGELVGAGFPIPPAFIVCADEYAEVIAGVAAGSSNDVYVDAVRDWTPSDEFEAELERCHETLQSSRDEPIVYAVRSSATAEDLGDASFAGQHETYYYVTRDELIPMIRACWASLWSDEAVAYRDTQGIEHSLVLMAVVVQEMIPSDVSGITFTANPPNGNRDEIVTDATWGMGAAIVDGRVTPDHYVVARESKEVTSQRIASKREMVSTRRMGDEQRMVRVPQHKWQQSCLSDDDLLIATDWALKSESHFGAPQDLKWAFYGGEYFMLQSRPITTLEIGRDCSMK